MRKVMALIVSPNSKFSLCILGGEEQIHVEAFLSLRSVNALDFPIVDGFPGCMTSG
jgi:hypothetical protein